MLSKERWGEKRRVKDAYPWCCGLQLAKRRHDKERKRMVSERLNEAAKPGRGSPSTLAGKSLGLETAGSSGCTEMFVDHVSNLSPSQESVVLWTTLLFDTYSYSEVNVRVEKLLQCRRNHRIKHIVVGEICYPCDRLRCHITRRSIDFLLFQLL